MDNSDQLLALGGRIRELRGGLSQAEFASKLEVDRKTVVRWEAGERTPDGASLIVLIRDFGADPYWLLLGHKKEAPLALTSEEKALIEAFRSMDARARAGVLGMVGGLTQGTADLVVHGDVGQVNKGQVKQRQVTFNVGKRK